MRNKQKLLIEQLSNKVQPFQSAASVSVPDGGWLQTYRNTLNMTLSQLGKKLGISRQGVKKIEENEAEARISLSTLKKAAEAMNLKLVYGLIPTDGSIDNLIQKKADEKARKIVLRTNHNMKLENQEIHSDQLEKAVKELADELKREVNRTLWD